MTPKVTYKIPHPVDSPTGTQVYENLGFWVHRYTSTKGFIRYTQLNKTICLVLLPRNNVLKESAVRILSAFSVKCYGVPGPDHIRVVDGCEGVGARVMVIAIWKL